MLKDEMVEPVIETARLRLRRHRADDLDERAAIGADPEVVRFLGGQPQSREESWIRLQRYAGHWALLGWGLFAVEDRRSGRLIGEAGLGRFERGMGPGFDEAPEAAWILATEATGQGLAQEAMTAALAWHEARFGTTRAVCLIGTENERSLRLAARLGFRSFRTAYYRQQPVMLLERLPLAPVAEAR